MQSSATRRGFRDRRALVIELVGMLSIQVRNAR
jgi:hypothetical protein